MPPAGRKSSLAAAQAEGLSWAQVEVGIVALGQPATQDQAEVVCSLMERFVSENENPKSSAHLRATAPDRLDPVVALLGRGDVARCTPQIRLLALQCVKILARRADIRLRCSQAVLEALVSFTGTPPLLGGSGGPGRGTPAGHRPPQPPTPAALTGDAARLASEAANALSNLASEPQNVSVLCRASGGGVARLLRLLATRGTGTDVRTNAAAALQTISFQADGRAALLKADGAAVLLSSLRESSEAGEAGSGSGDGGDGAGGANSSVIAAAAAAAAGKLQQRVVGALHNLSSSAPGIAAIETVPGGVPQLAALLSSPRPEVAAAAAGVVQNLSISATARAGLRRVQPSALDALCALLVGPNVQAACCAAGALANLCGTGGTGGERQAALVEALAGCVAGAGVYHSCGGGAWPPVMQHGAAPQDA